ncbi:MAG: translation initiation factor Sui1 [Planctomycetes bacterium]|nr:translation initiation factor Sui1 [Planctomycetota bacterium]
MSDSLGIVFSTEHGRMCPDCEKPADQCICSQKAQVYTGDGIVRVSRQTKGRKGKGVTIITGVPLVGDDLKKLATELKQKCGCGGTIKNSAIEIQGDKRDTVVEQLKKKGYTAKRSGG